MLEKPGQYRPFEADLATAVIKLEPEASLQQRSFGVTEGFP